MTGQPSQIFLALACAVFVGRAERKRLARRGGISVSLGSLRRRSDARRQGTYSVTRSGLRTLPDGEFDWGGTSVKR